MLLRLVRDGGGGGGLRVFGYMCIPNPDILRGWIGDGPGMDEHGCTWMHMMYMDVHTYKFSFYLVPVPGQLISA